MALRSKSYARILDLICEGEIEGLVDGAKSIYLDGTPVQSADGVFNFEEVEFEQRTGTNDQTYIQVASAVENELVVGAELTKPLPLVRTITNPDIDAVRIRISTPALFYQHSDGDRSGTEVVFDIDVQPSGGSYETVKKVTLKGKTTKQYEENYKIKLTGSAPWNIRLVRITNDFAGGKTNNRLFWETYTEIVDQKLRYPNSALIGIKFDSEYFDNVPTRAYDVKLLKVKVPSNYNPVTRTYTGIWDGTFKAAKEWTNNPAWCFYDLLTNERYGLGGYLTETQIDKWALYKIGRYCDELVPDGNGGTEPRFTCNMYIQGKKEAFNVIQDMASIFRGMVYWSAGQLTVTQDAPSDPVALYTTANVEGGIFNYSGSAAKARHTVALVSWNDPSDFYKQKVEYVEDQAGIERYGIIETQVTAIGCTSRGQANRVGKWLLFAEQNETETVSFTTGIEGCLARPGEIIRIADPTRAGVRMGGRIAAATLGTITVDADFSLPLSSTVFAVLPNGTVESRTVSSQTGRVLNLQSNLSAVPQVGAVWVISAPSVEAQTFRVVTVSEADDGKVTITGLKHEPNKYAAVEAGLTLQPRDITELTLTPAAPAELEVSEYLYRYNDEVRISLTASWSQAFGANRYKVEWIQDGGNVFEAETSSTELDIQNVVLTPYEIRVYSIGATGKVSTDYTSATIDVVGKTAPPADVDGFQVQIDPSLGVTLQWAVVEDLDLQGYEIRRGSNWDTAEPVAQNVSGNYFTVGQVLTGATRFWIKALDTSGNYSLNATAVDVEVEAPLQPTVTSAFAGENVVLNWSSVRGTFLTEEYEVSFGDDYETATSIGTVKGTTISTKASWSGVRKFWVTAVDIAGNAGLPGLVEAVVVAPSSVSITQEVIDNNVLLRWSAGTATLPIAAYEVRRGNTYATATVIGRISSLFTVIFETNAGDFRYWVTGIDVAGNFGAQSSVLVRVAQPPDYQLQFDLNSNFGGTKSNLIPEGSTLAGTFNQTETWQSHFTSRSWSTIQDQITAGNPYYLQPSAGTGYYEEVIDYGTVLAATKITATLTYTVVDGSPTITPKISVRKLTTDPWTDYDGQDSAFVTDFQYAKIRYTITNSSGNGLVRISGLNVRFDVKLINDAGSGTANASDSGGTQVNFNVPFVDVQSITVTPAGTTAAIAVYDFVDAPNPTSFKVLLFNTSGTRISGGFSWSAKGV